ncbi:MAG: hypothetical protein DVB27_02940 [Verrucomicrobia bacterium]|nr:MAG: hypothetical protein DVB27_02940 [Verrucomicrobiota bacterium]
MGEIFRSDALRPEGSDQTPSLPAADPRSDRFRCAGRESKFLAAAAFRARLGLPTGRLAVAAAVHTFGDYLVFHPHLHVFAADGLFDEEGRFHAMPEESLAPVTELFRRRFLQILRNEKHLSAQKVTDLLTWKHSGSHIDGGEKPVAPGDTKGRQRLAEYLLRAPFSLQKIHRAIRVSPCMCAEFSAASGVPLLAVRDRIKGKTLNLNPGLGFLTQRRKGAEDAELRSECEPESVHLLGEPVEPRTFPHSFACSASLRFPSHRCI